MTGDEILRANEMVADLGRRLSQIVGDDEADPARRITYAHALRRFGSAAEFRRSAVFRSRRSFSWRDVSSVMGFWVIGLILVGGIVAFFALGIDSADSLEVWWLGGTSLIGAVILVWQLVVSSDARVSMTSSAVAEWSSLRDELTELASQFDQPQVRRWSIERPNVEHLTDLRALDQLVALLEREWVEFEAPRWNSRPSPDHMAHVTRALVARRRQSRTARRCDDPWASPQLRILRRSPDNSRRDWMVHGASGPIGRLVAIEEGASRRMLARSGIGERYAWDRRTYELRDVDGSVLLRVESRPGPKDRRVAVGGMVIGSLSWAKRGSRSLIDASGRKVGTWVPSGGPGRAGTFVCQDSTVLARVGLGGGRFGRETMELLVDADDPRRPLVLAAWLLACDGAPQEFHETDWT